MNTHSLSNAYKYFKLVVNISNVKLYSSFLEIITKDLSLMGFSTIFYTQHEICESIYEPK